MGIRKYSGYHVSCNFCTRYVDIPDSYCELVFIDSKERVSKQLKSKGWRLYIDQGEEKFMCDECAVGERNLNECQLMEIEETYKRIF